MRPRWLNGSACRSMRLSLWPWLTTSPCALRAPLAPLPAPRRRRHFLPLGLSLSTVPLRVGLTPAHAALWGLVGIGSSGVTAMVPSDPE